MQTYAEMQVEIEKLNESQRKQMRSMVSRLEAVKVEKIGYKTRVRCRNVSGFHYDVVLGPRGKVIAKQVWEAAR